MTYDQAVNLFNQRRGEHTLVSRSTGARLRFSAIGMHATAPDQAVFALTTSDGFEVLRLWPSGRRTLHLWDPRQPLPEEREVVQAHAAADLRVQGGTTVYVGPSGTWPFQNGMEVDEAGVPTGRRDRFASR